MTFHRLDEPMDQPRTHTEMHGAEAEDTAPDRVILDSIADQTRRWIAANVLLGRKIRVVPCPSVAPFCGGQWISSRKVGESPTFETHTREQSVCIRKVSSKSPRRHEDTRMNLDWASFQAADEGDGTGSTGDRPVALVDAFC